MKNKFYGFLSMIVGTELIGFISFILSAYLYSILGDVYTGIPCIFTAAVILGVFLVFKLWVPTGYLEKSTTGNSHDVRFNIILGSGYLWISASLLSLVPQGFLKLFLGTVNYWPNVWGMYICFVLGILLVSLASYIGACSSKAFG